ncbi:MAG: D-alanine--D-alanine ligase family protein, partial [Candidatus Binatia bacterium]
MRRLRVLVLMHPSLVPPDSREGYAEKEYYVWKTEYDVVSTLRKVGHDVRPLGVQDELLPIRNVITEWKPHIVFNLLEEFHGIAEFDQHVVSLLELLRVPYTGCNPMGLILGRGKALSKKLLHYHRLPVPAFAVFPRGTKGRLRRGLRFPLIVKSLTEEASLGIAQASIVDTEEKLAERVRFVHESIRTDAIAEQFIEGRELYVGVLGNKRVLVLPVWEMVFENLPEGSAAIATARVKHNPEFQKKWGVYQQPAEDLAPALADHI